MTRFIPLLDKNRDGALLLVRVLLGAMFVFVHGGPKVFGGYAAWLKVGSMISVLGITSYPAALGFIAGFCELAGGVLIALGLFTRLGAAMILSTLVVAAATMYTSTHGLFAAAASIEDSLFMVLLIFIGGGKYSLDHILFGNRQSASRIGGNPAGILSHCR